jgi:putative polyketide hydroxylase
MDDQAPVLIVGAGVAGLSAALFLAQAGVRSQLVERRATTSVVPRARGVNGRTMELMRELGLDAEIRAAGEGLAPAVGLYRGRSLVSALARHGDGGWLGRKMRARGLRGHESRRSPTGPCRCTQDRLEPILLGAARARGVDVRFATELATLTQDDDGVTATLRDLGSGATSTVRPRYLLATDGARSAIRAQLGIARSGSHTFGHQLNVWFGADLTALVRGREFSMCLIENEHVRGLLASIDNATSWVIHISYDPERGERPEDFTPERLRELVRRALGLDDLAIELKGVSPWQSAVRLAERYRQGRVFLAGDAAHSMPPWGGFGANSAIQDAHNLAWKLALVLRGQAHPALLDTYEAERAPIDRTLSELAGSMNGERGLIATPGGGLGTLWMMRRLFPYLTMGYGYASPAVALEAGQRPPGPGTTVLDGRPGTRAPHVWLTRDGQRRSTLDLFGRGFVLLVGPEADGWRHAAREASTRLGLPLEVVALDDGRPFGLRRAGASLVRPDGIIGWRAPKAGPPALLTRACAQILAR